MSKILHVDDDGRWRYIVQLLLGDTEHTVESFATLSSAKEAAATGSYEAFLVDGSIDGRYDGLEWARELQQHGKKVAVLSSMPPGDRTIKFIDKLSSLDGTVLLKLLS